jgi:hypothetical protein
MQDLDNGIDILLVHLPDIGYLGRQRVERAQIDGGRLEAKDKGVVVGLGAVFAVAGRAAGVGQFAIGLGNALCLCA